MTSLHSILNDLKHSDKQNTNNYQTFLHKVSEGDCPCHDDLNLDFNQLFSNAAENFNEK